ncbi:DMT family transporter [Noviherbaspirillum cavernae]|uniref:DMT family transporter n=1 Tax=Noviherbaspirillum cavernae TaxID=2320862 RepID=A0A418X3W0_9BURK|nr:DMT family transporter [Noviherbaspirillum cavernae]RJG07143.1 DMT family transporter [Noviherbaspirillum cavernae]
MPSLWMLFASFVFAIMGVCVKLASDLYSTSEIVMYRGAVGMIFLFLLTRIRGGSLKTSLPWHHVWRGVVGVTALWLWFHSIGKLPLATATTLNYMSPIWIAAILFVAGWWRGQNRFEWGLTAAIAMSFVGVTLLLRPSFHADQWFSGLIGLTSGALSALAYLQVRKLGQMGEPEYRVVFYFSVTGVLAGLLGTLAGSAFPGNSATTWHAHDAKGLALLLAIGVTATIAQMAMTRAYRIGKTLVTANLQYTGIVFSAVWGIVIWGDLLDWLGWLGMGIILASGVAATYYNARNTAALTAKASAARTGDPISNEV